MRVGHGHAHAPAYNVQTAVDAEHALIVAQQVTTEATDNRSLLPMAEAAKQAVGAPDSLHVVADAGYSNGEQAEPCETRGILPHVPANRAINNKGDGTLFDRSRFRYDATTDTFHCPDGQTLPRKQIQRGKRQSGLYGASGGLWRMPSERSLHSVPATLGEPSPLRWCVGAYATTSHASRDATATIDCRASLRHTEIPNLRTPALSAARSRRSTD